MEDKDETKEELIEELKTLREEREESAIKDITKHAYIKEKFPSFTKNILDSSAVGIFILDSDFKVVWINHAIEDYFGLQREKVIGKDKRKLIKENIQNIFEEPDEFTRKVFATYDNNTYIENFECHVLSSGKREDRWLEHWSQPIKSGVYAGGRVEHYYNITERKQAEKALKESEVKYHSLFENTGTATLVFEDDMTISMVNSQAEILSGYSKNEIENKMKWTKFVVPEDLEKMKKYHFARRKAGETPPTQYEFRMINRKGKIKDIFLKIGMIPHTKKSIASLMDITERKKAEQNIKSAKDELQMIMDSVPVIIFYKDIEGRIIRANRTLADSLKVPIKDIVGKTTEKLFPREQAENMRKDDQEVIISGKPKRNIIQPYTTPGGLRWLLSDKIPYRDKKGKVTGVIVLAKDITVQRKSEQELQQTLQKLKKTMDATLETMSKIIEVKDPYTSGHQRRVCQLAIRIAQEMKLPEDKIEGIRIASLIHDIGKIGLPTEILSKPTKLTDIEFSLIKGHSQIGYDILKSIDFSYPVVQIVLQHHERLDGSGYPNNLRGNKIILEARILGVADVVEAMSSFRPYRPALEIDAALEEISKNKGILYDPEVVDACSRLFKEKGFKFE